MKKKIFLVIAVCLLLVSAVVFVTACNKEKDQTSLSNQKATGGEPSGDGSDGDALLGGEGNQSTSYALTLLVAGDGGTVSGGGSYLNGESVTLTATPSAGYNCAGWYDGTTKLENSFGRTYTFTMPAEEKTLVAKFERVYHRVDAAGAESATGEYILFGSYPQTLVSDETLAASLTAEAGTLPTQSNKAGWTSYEYYVEGINAVDYMWYVDLAHGGQTYRGVYFTSYRPFNTYWESNADYSWQDDNGYTTGNVYWFSYEPIKWRILSEKNGVALILCDLAIDGREFCQNTSSVNSREFEHNGGIGLPNNYDLCDIRKWLNDTFYRTAFDELQRDVILLTTVENGERTTSTDKSAYMFLANYDYYSGEYLFPCPDTNDYVFLLSEQEVTRVAYGFDEDHNNNDSARQKTPTDYAQAQGVMRRTEDRPDLKDHCSWYLRSAYGSGCYALCCAEGGSSWSSTYVCETRIGIVPALRILLA